MSMEQFSSALAPAIRDLILFKRECGAVYKHGEVLLGQFDQFCRNTEYEGTVLTEDLVMRWKQHNEYRKHRQKSQMCDIWGSSWLRKERIPMFRLWSTDLERQIQ